LPTITQQSQADPRAGVELWRIQQHFIDHIMADCTGAEVKAALYLYRRTVGFNKRSDEVSLTQICHGITRKDGSLVNRGTGLDRKSALKAAEAIVEKGLFTRERGTGPHGFVYTICDILTDVTGGKIPPVDTPPTRGKIPHLPVEKSHQLLGEKFHPQVIHSRITSKRAPAPAASPSLEPLVSTGSESTKLITGDESQNPAIRPPGRSSFAFPLGTENPKADTGGENLCAHAGWTDLQQLRQRLAAYMGEEPPEGFEISCLLRARGATVTEIANLLDHRWAKKKFRPGHKCGPRTWNWFLQVIGKAFAPTERGRLAEPAAIAHPSHTATPDEVARGIEALEANDPEDSLVRSFRCKCGNEIRQYASSRIVGTCTCGAKPFANGNAQIIGQLLTGRERPPGRELRRADAEAHGMKQQIGTSSDLLRRIG